MEDAGMVAVTVAGGPGVNRILTPIDYVLQTRQPEEVVQFIQITSFDGYFARKRQPCFSKF